MVSQRSSAVHSKLFLHSSDALSRRRGPISAGGKKQKQKTSRDELSAVPPRLQNTHRSRLGAEEESGRKVSQTAPGRLERTRILFAKVGAGNDSGTLSMKLGAPKERNTPSSPDPRLSTCERRHPTAINKKVRVCVAESPCSWLLCLPSSAYRRVSARISGRALSAADMKPLL